MSDAYGLRYQERLDSTADEAVRRAMNNGECNKFPIEIVEFKYKKIAKDAKEYADYILSNILEDLDRDYGDPDGEYSRPTERMKSAALEFAKALMDDYRVWEREPTGKVIQYSKEEAEKIAGNTSDNRRKK